MKQLTLLRETVETYRKHGWTLRAALLSRATIDALQRAETDEAARVGENAAIEIDGVAPREFELDALWFSRVSSGGREAWELRLVSPVAYALFELFEPDEAEEDRAEVRREMEARLREQFYEKNK